MGAAMKKKALAIILLAIMCLWAVPAIAFGDADTDKGLAIGLSEGGTYSVSTSSPQDSENNRNSPMNMTLLLDDEVTITATPEDGYGFKGFYKGIIQRHDTYQPGDGFVQDYDPDTLISTANPYTFTVSDDVVIYALFEETPNYDLTFDFPDDSPTVESLADLVSSITVNGTSWPLPTSGMSVTGQIPEAFLVLKLAKLYSLT